MYNVPIYESESVFENPKGRSEVIPNQALSIRDIVTRSSRGQFLAEVQGNTLQYGDDENEDERDFFEPDEDRFDQIDKLSYYEERLNAAKASRKAYEEQKKADEEASVSKATEESSYEPKEPQEPKE